jgi:hypothetical protein
VFWNLSLKNGIRVVSKFLTLEGSGLEPVPTVDDKNILVSGVK